jgi:hypothetical protein
MGRFEGDGMPHQAAVHTSQICLQSPHAHPVAAKMVLSLFKTLLDATSVRNDVEGFFANHLSCFSFFVLS